MKLTYYGEGGSGIQFQYAIAENSTGYSVIRTADYTTTERPFEGDLAAELSRILHELPLREKIKDDERDMLYEGPTLAIEGIGDDPRNLSTVALSLPERKPINDWFDVLESFFIETRKLA